MRRRTAVIIAASLAALVTITGVMATHFYSQQDAAAIKMLYQPYLPSDNESIVVICFDDGWKSQLNASEILDTFGFKATFAIVASYASNNYPAYMSWDEIRGLRDRGNDIECHSHSHIDLTNLSSDGLFEEIVKSKQVFQDEGFSPELFVYPLGVGFDNSTVRDIVSKHYLAARAVEDSEWDISDFDRYAITCFALNNDTSLSDFENIAWNAGGTTVIVLLYHQFDTGGIFSISRSQFVDEMSFLKANGFTVKTLSDLLFVDES